MTTATDPVVTLPDAEPPDVAVIAQILAGQTGLFELLMRRHNERVYRAARSIVRNEQEAEDVMQQAYVNAFTHLRQFNGSAQFSTWLTRIAINEALAACAGRAATSRLTTTSRTWSHFMVVSPSDNPERQAFTGELRGLLEGAIDALPDGMREVFVLRDVEGLSTAEVAECLDVSEDVVKTRLSRGRGDAAARVARADRRHRAGSLPFLPAALRSRRRQRARADRRPAAVTRPRRHLLPSRAL